MLETHIHSSDGTRLYVRLWCAGERGCVCIVHGLGEHSGRYVEVADFFQSHGYSVVAIDLRGHGRSKGWRGYVKEYRLLLEDVAAVLNYAAEEFRPARTFLYGQSMGGNIVINYVLKHSTIGLPDFDAAIVTSPMLRTTKPPPRWKEWLGRSLYNLLPWFSLWNGILLRYLSRDPKVGRKVLHDRRCHPWLSARLGISLVDSGKWALENASRLDKPMLLMHGEDDHVTSWAASREFAEAAGASCRFVSWPDARHELHHETNREEVLATMIDWMDEQTASQED